MIPGVAAQAAPRGAASVFVFAGQSNMLARDTTGLDVPVDLQSLPRVKIWSNVNDTFEDYVAGTNSETAEAGATTPQEWGPEASFARDWTAANPGKTCFIVKYAIGGTSLASSAAAEGDWNPANAGELFDTTTAAIATAIAELEGRGFTPAVEAVFWMQGEADADVNLATAQAYEANLTAFIAAVRTDWASASTPFILGRIADTIEWPYTAYVQSAQVEVAAAVADVTMVDTNDLALAGDGKHYTAAAVVTLGERFHDAYAGTYTYAPTDPEWANVVLLAGFDGVDGATTYTEESSDARVATFAGNAQLDTAQKRFGSASLLLDGSGDYVTFPDSDDFRLVSSAGENFCIDVRIRVTSNSTPASAQYIIGQYVATGNQRSWALIWSNGGSLQFAYSADGVTPSTINIISLSSIPTSSWYPVRITYDGTTIRCYAGALSANLEASAAFASTFHNSTAPLTIGARGDFAAGTFWAGHVDEVRITKGAARSTSGTGYVTNVEPFPRS